MTTLAPYGTWTSPSPRRRSQPARSGSPSRPSIAAARTGWRRARGRRGGRCWFAATPDGDRRDLTPAPFNVRTRVHEYGGGAYAVRDGIIVAANFADQRLYRIDQGGAAPHPLTPDSGGQLRYADMEFDLRRDRVLAVREDHRAGGEPVNTIVALALSGGDEGRVLIDGHDFFSSPRLSPDGRRLAWLSWDHPNMPWDGTRLWTAEIAADGSLSDVREVAGGDREAIVQPAWSPDNQLYFVSDRSGWWNLYRAANGSVSATCPMSAEFAGPAWAFGMRWYGFLEAGTILACFSEGGRWDLGTIDVDAGTLRSSAAHRIRSSRGSRSNMAGRFCAPGAPTARRRSSCSIRRADRSRNSAPPAICRRQRATWRGRRRSRLRARAGPSLMPSTIRRPIRTSAPLAASCRH